MSSIHVLIILISILSSCSLHEKEAFDLQVGTYILDIEQTDFSSTPLNSHDYKNLTVQFKEDATFIFSQNAPFIWDSCGTWFIRNDMDGFNNCYMNFAKDPDDSVPFGFYPYDPNQSNSIMFNGFPSKTHEYYIQTIFFIKLDSLK